MKKFLLVTDNVSENEVFIKRLQRKYEVDVAGSLGMAIYKLNKKPKDYGLIISEVSLSPEGIFSLNSTDNGEKTGIKFFNDVIKPTGIPTIFWDWSDEFRDEISELEGCEIIFVKKETDEDHLILAVESFY